MQMAVLRNGVYWGYGGSYIPLCAMQMRTLCNVCSTVHLQVIDLFGSVGFYSKVEVVLVEGKLLNVLNKKQNGVMFGENLANKNLNIQEQND